MSDKINLFNKIVIGSAQWIAQHMPTIIKYWTVVYAAGQTMGNPGELTVHELIDLILKTEKEIEDVDGS